MESLPHLQYSQRNPSRELNIVCIDNSESSRNEDYSRHIPTTRLEAQSRALDAIVRLSSHEHTQYSIISMAGTSGRTSGPCMFLAPTTDAETFVATGTEFAIGGDSISICAALNLALMTARQTTIVRSMPKRRFRSDALSRYTPATNTATDTNKNGGKYNSGDVLLNLSRVIKIYLFVCSVPRDIDQLKDTITKLSSTIGNLLVTVHLVSFGEASHNIKCIRSFGAIKELSTAFSSTKVIRIMQHKLPDNAETISSGYIGSLLLEKLAGKPHNSSKKDVGTCAETLSELLLERKNRSLKENNGGNGANGALLCEGERVPTLRIPGPIRTARFAAANDNCASLQPYIVEEDQRESVRLSFNISYLSKSNTISTLNVPINLYAENVNFKIPAGMCEERHTMMPGSQKRSVTVKCCEGEGVLVIQSMNSAVYRVFWVNSKTGAIHFRAYFFKGELKAKLTKLPDGRALVLTITRREMRFKKVFWIQVPENEMPNERIEEELSRCVGDSESCNPITNAFASQKLNSTSRFAPQYGVSPYIRTGPIIPTQSSRMASFPHPPSSSSSSFCSRQYRPIIGTNSNDNQQQQQQQYGKIVQLQNGSGQRVYCREVIQPFSTGQNRLGQRVSLIPLKNVVTFVPLSQMKNNSSEAGTITNITNSDCKNNGSNNIVNKSGSNDTNDTTSSSSNVPTQPNECNAAETGKKNLETKIVNNINTTNTNVGKNRMLKSKSLNGGATKKVNQSSKRNPRIIKEVTQSLTTTSPSKALTLSNTKAQSNAKGNSTKENNEKVIECEKTNYAVGSASGLRRSLRIHNRMKMTSSTLDYDVINLAENKNSIKNDVIVDEDTAAGIEVGEEIVENACNTSDDVIMENSTSSNSVNESANKENIQVESNIECSQNSSKNPTANGGFEHPQK